MSKRTIVILSFCLFAAAVLWGAFTLIIYLGIPVHQLVYSTSDEVHSMDITCGTAATISTYFCRGTTTIYPFTVALFKMASPFFAYIIVCAAILGVLLLWNGYRTGYFRLLLTMRPAYLIVMFVLSVWLIGTTFSLGTLYNMTTSTDQMVTDATGVKSYPPFGRFYEPLPQVYNGASQQALTELKANYDSLLNAGCLTQIGSTQNGAKVYDMSPWCAQKSMIARVGSQIALIGFLLLALLSLGRFIFKLVMRRQEVHPLLECVFSLGLGALGLVAILYAMALMSLLKSDDTAHGAMLAQIVFVALPVVFFKETWYWLKSAWQRTYETEISVGSWFPFLTWLLITYLALNFLNVVRPFPIGWDDLGSYLNRPRLLASYGSFIPSMAQFQWEYLTSLGYLLFGYDSIFGSTYAMLINWSAGLIAVLTVYAFGRIFFGPKSGVLAAILYYFLPMTGHFSFADMKIDNASFFTCALAILAVYAYLFPQPVSDGAEEKTVGNNRNLLIVAGLLAGFSFAVKPTAVLAIFLIFSTIAGSMLGPFGFSGMATLGFAVLVKFGLFNIKDISSRLGLGSTSVVSPTLVLVIFIILGLALLAAGAYKYRAKIRPVAVYFGLFIAGAAVAVAPWAITNMVLTKQISIAAMLTAPDYTAPQVSYEQEPAKAAATATPLPPTRYLPADLKLDPNNAACKTSAKSEELDRYWGFDQGVAHYLILPWRQVMNIDAFGYYVTLVPVLLLLPLLLLVPVFWTEKGRWLRMLFAGTFVFLFQWIFVANGIPWYGIGMFLGFALALEAFVVYAPDVQNRYLLGFFIAASIMICLVNRLWQFDSQKNLFEYPLGKITAGALQEVTIPDYDDIRKSAVARHEALTQTPYTYRVGTFISYFIPRNREIFPLADHQLQFFNCLDQERDHTLTLKRLKALGFNSIIFDTNTATIEKDPNGSLHQKVNAFLAFANDPVLKLDLVVNDPGNGIAYIVLP